MTNGEMIRVMFPKTIFIHSIKADDERAMIYSNEWWNDSYKGNVIPISVIEDIKAEIKDQMDDDDYFCGLSLALQIIDKHISGKENE